jgi:hypothetical protein
MRTLNEQLMELRTNISKMKERQQMQMAISRAMQDALQEGDDDRYRMLLNLSKYYEEPYAIA